MLETVGVGVCILVFLSVMIGYNPRRGSQSRKRRPK